MSAIKTTKCDEDIHGCFPVMHELRSHLDERAFFEQVKRQMETQRYKLAFVEADGDVVAVAGYRIVEMLAWGKTLYVDDLVTQSTRRSEGFGEKLFDWLIDQAKQSGCEQFHLDSGVQRFAAHRFYLRKRMDITSHHFAIELSNANER